MLDCKSMSNNLLPRSGGVCGVYTLYRRQTCCSCDPIYQGGGGILTDPTHQAPHGTPPGQSYSSSLLRLGGVLGDLLLPRDGGLDADAPKDEADAEPLHLRQAVAEGDHGQDHGEHLARHGHGHQQHRGEGRQRVGLM